MAETKTGDMTERLDELFMAGAEGERDAWEQLLGELSQLETRVLSLRSDDIALAWAAGTELLLEALNTIPHDLVHDRLLHALARSGYDTPRFRDALAMCLRRCFRNYADPAGMITALGVLDSDCGMTEIARRWDVFAVLAEGVECRHEAHGFGRVEEIDSLGNEVRIRFERTRTLSLDVALASVVYVRPGSLLDRLRRKEIAWPVQQPAEQAHTKLLDSLVPEETSAHCLSAFLLPDVMNKEQYAVFMAEAAGETAGPGAKAQSEESIQRAVAEARSLEELSQILRNVAHLTFSPEDSTNVEALMSAASTRRDLASLFALCTAHLWRLADQAPWLDTMLETCREAICWNQDELFIELTDNMPGKLISCWFEATLCAVGTHRTSALIVLLPLRYWTGAVRTLRQADAQLELLRAALVSRAKSADTSADMLVWLWENAVPEKDLLRDITLVFRTLAKPVRGSYLKAAKDLRKLLLRDVDFQKFLLNNGDPQSGLAVLRAIEHQPVLDQGEKQSLLVRLVRHQPELRAEIEKRAGPATVRKGQERITSVHSFELRRNELQDIVQTRIPANSRALAHARSYGDLRENAEYKAAKDEQAFLNAKRSELENDLDRVKTFNFLSVIEFDRVVPGSSVVLRKEDQSEIIYHLAGLWDSAPDKNILSYETPLGKNLLGRRVDEHVKLPDGKDALVIDIRALPADMIRFLNHEE